MARKKKSQTLCAAIYAVIIAFALIFTNVTSTKYFFLDHIKAHNNVAHEHNHGAAHSSDGLHGHEREEFHTHSHTGEDGTTQTHKHHHDHCATKLASPIIAYLQAVDCELFGAISLFLPYSWTVSDPIISAHCRELLRPPILA